MGETNAVKGDQGDIMIAGVTAYDQQAGLTALEAIAAEWAGTDLAYATRVQAIEDGLGGLPALNGTGVWSTGGPNTLQDNTADWVFVRQGQDSFTDGLGQAVRIP